MAEPVKMWEQCPLGKAVAAHIKNGLWVFPLHGINDGLVCTCGAVPCGKDNKNAGKHPYTPTAPNGLLNATNDFEVAAEMFQYRIDLNVGIVTGKKSGIVVIDIDNKAANSGDASLVRIQELLGMLPSTMCLTTGNGYHLVFDYPEGGLKTNSNSYGKEYPGIDIRGDGGYIVIYPSRHYSGRYYEADTTGGVIADLPQAHLDFLRADRNKKQKDVDDRSQRSGNTSEWTEGQIAHALTFLEPDMAYLDWIFIGMALHKEGFPLDMWDKWSATGRKYNGIGDLNTHWKSFNSGGARTIGTIIDWAMVQGWEPKGQHIERVASAEADAAVSPLIKNIKEKKRLATHKEKMTDDLSSKIFEGASNPPAAAPPPVLVKNADESIPYVASLGFNPLELPGGLGDTIRWITRHSLYEQPELALYNVLAFAGAVFGRKYASPLDTRTNLYIVATADTGLGKEHSVKMMEVLAMDAGLMDYVGENSIRSDVGLMKSVMAFPSQLMMVDEFGKLMTALSDPKSSHHHKAVIDFFTKIYSKSSGVFKGGRIADDRAPKIAISCPNLCVYGVTTEKSYIPSLKRAAIDSGDLNRFVVLPAYRRPIPKREIPKRERDENLIEWWNGFISRAGSSLGAICNSASILPVPKIVSWGECEQRQYDISIEQTARRDSRDGNKNLWLRLHENTIKIAMIFAIARDPENPIMTHSDFDYAYNIVRSSIEYMTSLAETGISENSQEQSHNEVLKAIVAAGENGLSRREMLRMFRGLRKRDTDDLIATFKEEEVIVVGRSSPRIGRPQAIYYAAETETARAMSAQSSVAAGY